MYIFNIRGDYSHTPQDFGQISWAFFFSHFPFSTIFSHLLAGAKSLHCKNSSHLSQVFAHLATANHLFEQSPFSLRVLHLSGFLISLHSLSPEESPPEESPPEESPPEESPPDVSPPSSEVSVQEQKN